MARVNTRWGRLDRDNPPPTPSLQCNNINKEPKSNRIKPSQRVGTELDDAASTQLTNELARPESRPQPSGV